MTLVLEEKGLLNVEDRRNVFDDGFARMLTKLPNSLTKFFKSQMNTTNVEDVRILNRNLAMFIKDLFNVFDRGIAIDMVWVLLCKKILQAHSILDQNLSGGNDGPFE